jgi:hypothetical protein
MYMCLFPTPAQPPLTFNTVMVTTHVAGHSHNVDNVTLSLRTQRVNLTYASLCKHG